MTIRAAPAAAREGYGPTSRRRARPLCSRRNSDMFGLHYRLERKAMGLVLAIIGVASIGGLVEIAPLFTIHQTVENAPDMRRLHAARARRTQHLHSRGMLRLPFADDPHVA